ncbi:YccT family protein [Amphritea sp.]|uniref:YccT family protein n=1 Tax=Amphritea sp. TaxID=1872502 RepID=UPI003D0FF781
MRFSLNIFFPVFILASTTVMAEVELSAGSGISIIAVNGVEVESDSLIGNNISATLPNGINQILVNYSAEIESSGDLEIETTNPHIIVFKAEDSRLVLSAPEITRISDFNEFDKSQQWKLADGSGSSISYQSKPLIKEGFQLSRDYASELQRFNQSGDALSINSFAPINRPPVTLPINSVVSGVNISSLSNGSADNADSVNLPEKLLQYWYLKADAETRERFKVWISNK